MNDEGVVILGIPIPSSSPVFLILVAVHVAAGLTCVVSGIVAMLAPKEAGRHPVAGTVYIRALAVVFVSMSALSVLRWPHNNHLFALGLGAFGSGLLARRSVRHRRHGWATRHVTGMAVSYVLLLTAFYVDNGPHLPLWRSLPSVVHWIAPSLVGIPLLAWILARHPLVRGRAP
jgi:uncharacterized membrane protein